MASAEVGAALESSNYPTKYVDPSQNSLYNQNVANPRIW